MESRPNIMMAPICLVENKNEKLSVNQEALEILKTISQPVVVVAIVGMYRTGKSYLMNNLAGQSYGFYLSSTIQSKTKGIWMWCLPHPIKADHVLILLDTEGLGDVEKNDPKNDSWIFALAVLLCSSLVYNSIGTINHQALEQLQYVTELRELIKAKSSPCPDGVENFAEFVGFFPDFIWTIRDFYLELKIDGHRITEDEYLENALKLIQSRNPKIEISNTSRECIKRFFPKRKCFVFDRPINDRNLLANIENVPKIQLDPQFQEQTMNFCSYIFTHAKIKKLNGGAIVTGKRLSTLVVTYVDAIRSGAVPCLENAVTTLAQLENSAAVQMASDHYREQMTQRVKLPTDTVQELLDMHTTCEKEAIAIFMKHSFKDENQQFQKDLEKIIKDKKEEFLWQNEEASVKCCQAIIEQLSKVLMASVSAGAFSVPGGHQRYLEIQERIKQDYQQAPRKGVKSNEVFQNFLQSQEIVEKCILQLDTALAEGEKAIAEERTRRERDEKEQELLKQKQQVQQLIEDEKKRLQEIIAQLEHELIQQRENLREEYNKTLEHKMKSNEVFQNFLQSQEAVEKCILQLDTALTEGKNALAGTGQSSPHHGEEEQTRRERSEKKQELLKQKQQEQQQFIETEKKSHKKSIAQLEQKLIQRRETLQEEDNKALEHKMKVTMATGPIMKEPICLVENSKNELRLNPEALNILETISQPVVVVAIAGLYRTGKSYLMNRLIGQNHGFHLGYTVKAETKGIWMMCVPHPTKKNHTLILLDTEGLGDVEKGDSRNDSSIFTLAVLLSSVFIYNSIGTINYQVMEQLQYITELANKIRIKSSPSTEELDDSAEFVTFFPDFIWTLRDFTLKLESNGQSISEDEYLENALKLIQGEDTKIKKSNDCKHCIRKFFPKRKCFVFKKPTKDDDLLLSLEEASENQLESIFQEQSQNFCSYIFTNAKLKTIKGKVIKGNGLRTLVISYVNAINHGEVPCLENAVESLAQQENTIAVQKAVDHYSEQMTQQVKFPTESLQDLLDVHAACEKEAIAIFMEHSFKDEERTFQKKLLTTIQHKKETFLLQNEDASLKYCQDELRKISETLQKSISKRTFFMPGGYKLYLEAKNKVEKDYASVPKKGVKANEVLQSFLKSQESVEQAILNADQSLTEAEKSAAEEEAKNQAYKKENDILNEKKKMEEQKMEAEMKTLKENNIQLREKLEREKEIYLQERANLLAHMLENKDRLLTEGFQNKAEEMNRNINKVEEEIKSTRRKWISTTSEILITTGTILVSGLPGIFKVFGGGVAAAGMFINCLNKLF